MINLSQLSQLQILVFSLVFLRCSAFLMSAPIFSSSSIAAPFKILFSLALAMLLFPTISLSDISLEFVNENLVMLVIREILVGLSLGAMSRAFFFTVNMVGDLLSISMGLGAAQMYNPISGGQSQVLDQFYTWFATMIFLVLGGHHILIQALASSFDVVGIAQDRFSTGMLADVVVNYYKLLIIAIQIAAPVIIAMLLTHISMGILGRTVPQINVLVTSFPISILLGLLILIVTTPMWFQEMNQLLNYTSTELIKLMKAI